MTFASRHSIAMEPLDSASSLFGHQQCGQFVVVDSVGGTNHWQRSASFHLDGRRRQVCVQRVHHAVDVIGGHDPMLRARSVCRRRCIDARRMVLTSTMKIGMTYSHGSGDQQHHQ